MYVVTGTEKIRSETAEFSRAIRKGNPATALGAAIYKDLFGMIPEVYLRHTHWLLELDGPLYELPFAALVTEEKRDVPSYLVERAALQTIPSALLLKRGTIPGGRQIMGIGNPIPVTKQRPPMAEAGGNPDLTLEGCSEHCRELTLCPAHQNPKMVCWRQNVLQRSLRVMEEQPGNYIRDTRDHGARRFHRLRS